MGLKSQISFHLSLGFCFVTEKLPTELQVKLFIYKYSKELISIFFQMESDARHEKPYLQTKYHCNFHLRGMEGVKMASCKNETNRECEVHLSPEEILWISWAA